MAARSSSLCSLQVPQHGDVFGEDSTSVTRLRKWRLDGSRVTSSWKSTSRKPLGSPAATALSRSDHNLFSVGDYWIEGYRAKYSGPGALVDVPVVGGEYSSASSSASCSASPMPSSA